MDKKKIFFTLLLIIVCVVLLFNRFKPEQDFSSFEVSSQIVGNSIDINFASHDIYIKGEETNYPILKIGENIYPLNEEIINTYPLKAKTSLILTIPKSADTILLEGTGNIYINDIQASKLSLSANKVDIDSANIKDSSLNTKGASSVSNSSFSTLYIKGNSGPINISESLCESIMAETIISDIYIDNVAATFIQAISDKGNVEILNSGKANIVLQSEEGIINIDKELIEENSENTIVIKTNSGDITIKGE